MVPVVMAIILGLIYGLGEVFNVLSNVGHKITPASKTIDFETPGIAGSFFYPAFVFKFLFFLPIVASVYPYLALGKARACRYIVAYITTLTGVTDGTYMGTSFLRAPHYPSLLLGTLPRQTQTKLPFSPPLR